MLKFLSGSNLCDPLECPGLSTGLGRKAVVILEGGLLGRGISGLFGFCVDVWCSGRSGFSVSFNISSNESLSVELSTESSDSPNRSIVCDIRINRG